MNISLTVFFWTGVYILFLISNIYLMRELLIIDRDRIESFIDVIITLVIILIPLFGTLFIAYTLEEQSTMEYKNKRKLKARKFIYKLFNIK